MSARLSAHGARIAYDRHVVFEDLDVQVPAGAFTAIVGPNACGKSTLLRTLARLHRPAAGRILLDGQDIARLDTKAVARRVGMLPQSALVPEHMSVEDLVARGRFPHQGVFRQWTAADAQAVARAMEVTGVADLASRPVDELSGGQRQRAWIALVLAQDTETILLDEPTTFLDLAHQVEVLELCRELNEHQGRTVVAVLHDLNQAARCAAHMIVMHQGRVLATGRPQDIVTEAMVSEVFGLDAVVVPDPVAATPMVIPRRLGAAPPRPSAPAGPAGDPQVSR